MNQKHSTGTGKSTKQDTVFSVAEVFEPITRIGIETELSRYPVHNLSKKGAVNIQITKQGPDGLLDLKWEVSYSDRYGQARQVAYKIDTIIVNRKIDEAGRPLPKFIKIGTLTDMCKDLGLTPGGQNKNMVKKGILQNASAFITAKLKYRGKDGGQKTLEAGFTRYSVTFNGEKLPDGTEADSIYIVLNEPYREVLNNAPIRPLNYTYLKSLSPSPQRFYEIISSRIYAAIKNKNPLARISYSEFCTYSALTRHTDHENFRVQMAKVHRPHLLSGYIARVTYETNLDQTEGLDWMMCYKPGPRAMAEYMTFTNKKRAEEKAITIDAQAVTINVEAEKPVLQESAELTPESGLSSQNVDHPLLEELTKRGISPSKARTFLSALPEGQPVTEQLEWADQLLASEPAKFKNPAGFYVYVLTDNVTPPPGFESARQRAARQQAQAQSDEEYCKQQQQRIDYEEICYHQIERFAKALPEEELQDLCARKRQKLSAWIKSFSQMTAENQQNLVWSAVKAEIKLRVALISFKEFVLQQEAGQGTTTASTAPQKPVKQAKQAKRTPRVKEKAEARTTPEEAQAAPQAAPQPAIDAMDIVELGRRRSAARNYLLTAHPDRLRFHQMLDDGRYDEFTRESEEQLLADSLQVVETSIQ